MFAMPPGFLQPHGGGGGGDPYFANVALLLRGDSTTDLSNYAHALGAGPGGGISFDTNDLVPGVVSSWIKTSAGTNTWSYASAAEWGSFTSYTIDAWFLLDALPGSWLSFTADDFSRFFVFSDGGGGLGALSQQGTYGAMADTVGITLNTPHYFRLVSDGADVSRYLDGVQVETNGFTGSATGAKGFELLDATGAGALVRWAEIRITQGVARNDPADLTVPLQTAPWPDS